MSRVELHRPAIRSLKFDDDVIAQVREIAAAVYETALALSPKRTGHYARSLYVEVVRGASPRVVIGATDFKAWWIEYGAYGRNPPFPARAVLRKSLKANGLKFRAVKR